MRTKLAGIAALLIVGVASNANADAIYSTIPGLTLLLIACSQRGAQPAPEHMPLRTSTPLRLSHSPRQLSLNQLALLSGLKGILICVAVLKAICQPAQIR